MCFGWIKTKLIYFCSSHKRSEVDDDFFDLEKFNAWTEEQERRDMMSDPEDDDEEQIDYDNDLNAIADSDGEQEDLDDVAGKLSGSLNMHLPN